MSNQWPIPMTTVVVTSTYVTTRKLPVHLVSRELDEEEGEIWQFHSDNGDFRPEVMQLVSLGEILAIDPSIESLASLPMAHTARRAGPAVEWVIAPDAPQTSSR